MNKAFAAIELILLITILAGIAATTRLAGQVQNIEKYASCFPAECSANSDCGANERCSLKCCIPNTNPTSPPRPRPATPPACSYGSCSNCLAAMYSSSSVCYNNGCCGGSQPSSTPISNNNNPSYDNCGSGTHCVSYSGGKACLNAGGDVRSCTTASGGSGTCCIPGIPPTLRPVQPTTPPASNSCSSCLLNNSQDITKCWTICGKSGPIPTTQAGYRQCSWFDYQQADPGRGGIRPCLLSTADIAVFSQCPANKCNPSDLNPLGSNYCKNEGEIIDKSGRDPVTHCCGGLSETCDRDNNGGLTCKCTSKAEPFGPTNSPNVVAIGGNIFGSFMNFIYSYTGGMFGGSSLSVITPAPHAAGGALFSPPQADVACQHGGVKKDVFILGCVCYTSLFDFYKCNTPATTPPVYLTPVVPQITVPVDIGTTQGSNSPPVNVQKVGNITTYSPDQSGAWTSNGGYCPSYTKTATLKTYFPTCDIVDGKYKCIIDRDDNSISVYTVDCDFNKPLPQSVLPTSTAVPTVLYPTIPPYAGSKEDVCFKNTGQIPAQTISASYYCDHLGSQYYNITNTFYYWNGEAIRCCGDYNQQQQAASDECSKADLTSPDRTGVTNPGASCTVSTNCKESLAQYINRLSGFVGGIPDCKAVDSNNNHYVCCVTLK